MASNTQQNPVSLESLMRKTLFTASVLAVALAAPFAQAHQAGDVIVRAGAITVDPREDSGNVKIGGVAAPGTGATLTAILSWA